MQLPVCAVCDHPVEELCWKDDPLNQLRKVGVKCHGDYEEVTITFLELMESSQGTLTLGKAFATQKLLDKNPHHVNAHPATRRV